MLCRLLLAMSLLWLVGHAGQVQGQAKSQEAESVLETRMRLDSSRWFSQDWANQPLLSRLRTTPDDPKPVSEYVREFVTQEQFKVLTDVYNKRLHAHQELADKMYLYDVLEKRARIIGQGRSEDMVRAAYPVPKGFVAPKPEGV